MSKEIYFKDLPELTQQRILDQFGAISAEELGLDKIPYATIQMDCDGVGAIGFASRVKTA